MRTFMGRLGELNWRSDHRSDGGAENLESAQKSHESLRAPCHMLEGCRAELAVGRGCRDDVRAAKREALKSSVL